MVHKHCLGFSQVLHIRLKCHPSGKQKQQQQSEIARFVVLIPCLPVAEPAGFYSRLGFSKLSIMQISAASYKITFEMMPDVHEV